MACINQPFEVLRITIQAKHARGEHATTGSAMRELYSLYGFRGFYAGVIPRMMLSAWQTLFMVTFADMVKQHMK